MKNTTLAALIIFLILGVSLMVFPLPASAKTTFVTIGTGDINGVYYPTGGAIAKMVNQKKDEYGIRAVVESTGGSVDNVNGVMAGDLQFGIVQSDRQFQAVKGQAEWSEKPQENLRSVFSLYPEVVTVVASDASGITTLADLKGKKVNIGPPGSGQLQNALDALSLVHLDDQRDSQKEWVTEEIKPGEVPTLFQEGIIDAFFTTVGHPCEVIRQITEKAPKVHFVPIEVTDEFLDQHPYYTRTEIPATDYPNMTTQGDVPTFGANATLVTSADVPDEVVYAVTKVIFDNLVAFKKSHPALAGLTKAGMLKGLTAPIHPGAMKYYQESGLDKNLRK